MNLLSIFNLGKVKPNDPQRGIDPWFMRFVPSDLRLTREEQITLSAVWACIQQIVNPLASAEVRVFTTDAKKRRTHLAEDPVSYLLNTRPCPDYTAQAFKEIVLFQTLTTGNGFAEIVRDAAGRVVELWPLISDAMQLVRDPVTGDLLYRYTQQDASQVFLKPSQVLHIRGPSTAGLLGASILNHAAKAIALGVAQETFATSYYANGTMLGGFIKFPQAISPEAKDRLRTDFKARYGGHKRANGIAFLEGGMDYMPLNVDAEKSQLVTSRQFSTEEIARFFGVPLVLLGVQAAAQGYGTNVGQLYLTFVLNTLTPWCNRFTEEVEFKVFPARAPWRTVEIDLTPLTLGDAKDRATANEINIRSGVLTVNEAREIEGRNSLGPEGDVPTFLRTVAQPAPPEPDPEDTEDPKDESAQEDEAEGGEPTDETVQETPAP